MAYLAVLRVLAGSLLTATTAWALGVILLRRLGTKIHAGEELPLAFVTGSACLSSIVFILCCLHLVYDGVLLAIAAVLILCAVRTQATCRPEKPLDSVPRYWKIAAWVVVAAFAVLYLSNAMAPEHSPDGAAYHIPVADHYYRAHGFERVTWNMLFNLSQGVELLFLFSYAFGGSSAGAMVHLTFLFALPWLMLSYSRRFGFAIAGLAGALFVFVSPIVGIDGTSAYVDVALGAVGFAMFYFLELWNSERDARLLIPIGIVSGFTYAIKYTGAIAILYAVAFVGWKLWRDRRPVLRPIATVALTAALFVVPWMAKNALFVGNPVAPFANRMFPNPSVHVSLEDQYRDYMSHMRLTNRWRIPLELTVKGDALQGMLGPLFLLAPVSLLALRYPAGRRLLLAACVFGAAYFTSIASRFFIPALPFLSLALALAFANSRPLLLALVLAHAAASWPNVMRHYCDQWTWRLHTVPWKAALRIQPEAAFLQRLGSDYSKGQLLDQVVPEGQSVLAMGGIAQAFTKRDAWVPFLAAQNELLADTLFAPLEQDQVGKLQFHFSERALRKIRITQTAQVADDNQWSVTDIRMMRGSVALARDAAWHITARPNPWDAGMAFDGNPVTRWMTWQPARAGMYVEADFGSLQLLDGVQVECTPQYHVKLEVDGMDASGRWAMLSNTADVAPRSPAINLRAAATAELKRRGVRYLLMDADDQRTGDFETRAGEWGVSRIAELGSMRLYRIE